MADRPLTPEEIAALGLNEPGVPTEGAPIPVVPEEAVPPPPPADPGLGRSLLAAFGQGGLKGGSDELSGRLLSLLVGEGTGKGDVYRKGRDAERDVLRGAHEHHPVASFVSDMAGDIGTDYLMSLLGVPVTSTQYQAAVGGLSGLMRNEADNSAGRATSDNAESMLGSGVLGAGLGAVAPKVGEKAAKFILPRVMPIARDAFEKLATSQANKLLLNGARSLANRLPVSGEALMQALRDRAIVPFGTVGGAAQRLEKLAEDRGAQYGAIVDRLVKAGVRGPEAEPLARSMAAEAERLAANSGSKKAAAEVWKKEADNIRALARPPAEISMAAAEAGGRGATELGLDQALNVTRALQHDAKYGRFEDTPVNEQMKKAASKVRQAIEDAVEAGRLKSEPGSEVDQLADEFVPTKQQLSRTLEAKEAATAGAAKAANRSPVSLPTWTMAAGKVAAGGSPVDVAASVGLMQSLLNRGGSTVASGAYDLSRAAGALSQKRLAAILGSEGTAALSRQAAQAEALKKGKKR